MSDNLFFPDSHCAKCRDDGKMEIAVIGICMSLLTGICTYIDIYFLANSKLFGKMHSFEKLI